MQAVLEKAVEAYRRESFLTEFNNDVAILTNPAWLVGIQTLSALKPPAFHSGRRFYPVALYMADSGQAIEIAANPTD